jgi:uncharacterized membrane protein YczE
MALVMGFVSKGELLGVREGTIAAAVLVGLFSKQICKPVKKIMDRLI